MSTRTTAEWRDWEMREEFDFRENYERLESEIVDPVRDECARVLRRP